MNKKDKQIHTDAQCTIHGVSCRYCYKETSKLIDGYNQLSSIPRALGFENSYEVQQKLHKYRHLINADDVETVVRWLFENGYDIVKLPNGS